MKQPRIDFARAGVDNPMSMTAFFEYLDEKPATSDLAKALSQIVMLRTCGARSGRAA